MAWFPAVLLTFSLLSLNGQIIVPDRLPDGSRMEAFTTSAEWGTFAFDSLRTLPEEQGGRDTWWHRHALFMDGPIRVAMDPVLDVSQDALRRINGQDDAISESGHRNVRGVRYSGSIDNRVRFGGKVLEMQRLLVAPETEYILASGQYPGMGPGKLRPAEDGLYRLDHSLAEVWFDAQPKAWLRVQWGLGASQLGPGTRNVLWDGRRAPAPYLLVAADLGKGWTLRWEQSRQRGIERLAADGAREGRYHPLGLGLRSLTKSFGDQGQALDITFMSVQWTDVLQRGQHRRGIWDWGTALAPWHLPGTANNTNHPYLAAHVGVDVQWRRPRSTWYGQWRIHPTHDHRYALAIEADLMDPQQFMVGHVRHGTNWTLWTEWAPAETSVSPSLSPLLPVGDLGIQPWSPWRPDFIQGLEASLGGMTLTAEAARIPKLKGADHEGMTWKGAIALPSRAADTQHHKRQRHRHLPNRWWPQLVPLSPFMSVMVFPNARRTWWSFGIASPAVRTRKSH